MEYEDEPPDCKYGPICKYHKEWCRPKNIALAITSCWRKSILDDILKEGMLERLVNGKTKDI